MNTASFDPSIYISAFLGFASALLVQAIWARLQSRATRKKHLHNLSTEVQVIRNALQDRLRSNKAAFSGMIDASVWRSGLASGAISSLTQQEAALFSQLYSSLDDLSAWERIETEFYLSIYITNADDPVVQSSRIGLRDHIKDLCKHCLQLTEPLAIT